MSSGVKNRIKSLSELKKLTDCLSPLSWIFQFFASYFLNIILLVPSFFEILLLLFVEFTSHLLIATFDGKFFTRFYPRFSLFYKKLDLQAISKLDEKGQKQLFESLLSYPDKRIIWMVLTSFVKVTPGIFTVVFLWDHQNSNLQQFFVVMSLSAVNLIYFYGTLLPESHILISKHIQKIHSQFYWKEIFLGANIRYQKNKFFLHEVITLSCLFLFAFLLQLSVFKSSYGTSETILTLKLLAVTFVALFLYSRIWILNRKLLIGGIENLFHSMSDMKRLNNRDYEFVLPLSSNRLLANFEQAFNVLLNKLRASEQELSALVVRSASKSRFKTLGEISGLVAHDLSGPLHVAQFCVEQINENPELLKNKKYISNLDLNIKRSVELVESLRAKLKNPKNNSRLTNFYDAHIAVMRLLKTQFPEIEFNKINFKVDAKRLKEINLKISRIDMIHILDNIYRNSVENLLSNNIVEPELVVGLLENNDSAFEAFEISDNGSGLSGSDFADLTSFRFMQNDSARGGLGLRLTKRLIEINKGELNLLSHQDGGNREGTFFVLKLRTVDDFDVSMGTSDAQLSGSIGGLV